MTKGMLMMWGVFSEMERDIISQRVRSGMKNAAAKGKRIGRPKTTAVSLPDKFWKYKAMYEKEEISIAEFARLMDCSRTTIYKYLDIAADRIED
jgi:DNA invertase Pin-like site-specific DNA recombinase